MLTKEAAKNGQALRSPAARQDEALRKLALTQLERVRSFKVHLAVFLVGMPNPHGRLGADRVHERGRLARPLQ
jgi:hypothetical protein